MLRSGTDGSDVFFVSIPRPWIRGEEVEKGDETVVLSDGVVLILPPRTTLEEIRGWKRVLAAGPDGPRRARSGRATA